MLSIRKVNREIEEPKETRVILELPVHLLLPFLNLPPV
jgi:hypothetical protein